MATTTTKKAPAKKATAKKTTKKTPLLEREPKVLVTEAGYAAAGLADEALSFVRELPAKVDTLRAEAPAKAKEQVTELRTDGPDKAKAQVTELRTKAETRVADAKKAVEDYRAKLVKEFEARVKTFEKSFDKKVKAGKKVVTDVKKDERVKNILDNADTTTSKVKGAVTSIRKTADVAVDATKAQAENAKTQVKAAATSAKKTADAVVDAGKELAS